MEQELLRNKQERPLQRKKKLICKRYQEKVKQNQDKTFHLYKVQRNMYFPNINVMSFLIY